MLLNIVFIIVGVALVIWGADRLTDGAASLARGMNVPEIIIGLTIVAAGTSAPELFVSMVSAFKGTADLAVGNVIGSNIFNTMLIVGCSAVVAPMAVAKSTVKKDIPFAVIASILLFMLCFDDMDSPHLWGNEISRSDGFILLTGFLVFMVYTFNAAKKEGLMPTEEEREDLKEMPKDAATYVAYRFGVRPSVVGLTIVAGGTSLPELATSVVAAYKGRSAIAIGNVIGSNVFNVLLILGVTAAVHPLRIMGITIIDLMMMLVSVGLLWLFAFTKYSVSRKEGLVLIGSFLAYMCWLIWLL